MSPDVNKNKGVAETAPVSSSKKLKDQNKICGFNGIWTHELCNTGAMLYQLGFEASMEAGQVRVQFIEN